MSVERYISDAEFELARGNATSALAYVRSAVAELKQLQEADNFLSCLEACGVDNWEGYSDAYRMSQGEDPYA